MNTQINNYWTYLWNQKKNKLLTLMMKIPNLIIEVRLCNYKKNAKINDILLENEYNIFFYKKATKKKNHQISISFTKNLNSIVKLYLKTASNFKIMSLSQSIMILIHMRLEKLLLLMINSIQWNITKNHQDQR